MTPDLTTTYLGLTLDNPIIVAACPLTRESHRIEQLEQAGAAAVVMYSLFAEQVEGDRLKQVGTSQARTADLVNVLPLPHDFIAGIDGYLRNIELAKKEVSIPIIGSLNGSEPGEWIRSAKLIESAGADALELNVYFVPTDPNITGAQVEEKYFEIISAVRKLVSIPLSVKLGPFFSSLPNFVLRLSELGVEGLVLFNRFLQPDIDTDSFEVSPRLTLSTSEELRLPLRWIAILRSQTSLSLASSSGAHSADDVAKLILAGADVVSMASALLKHGPGHLSTVIADFVKYMEQKQLGSVDEMRALATRQPGSDKTAFERANYIKTIISYDEELPH